MLYSFGHFFSCSFILKYFPSSLLNPLLMVAESTFMIQAAGQKMLNSTTSAP